MNDGEDWTTQSSSTLLSRPHLQVVEEEVASPRGKVRKWLTVQRKQAVVVAARTARGRFVLIREERVPVRSSMWCLPAGQIDDDLGDIVGTAERELREETGYGLGATGTIKRLGHFFTSPGLTNECVHFCLAEPVMHAGGEVGADEMILEVREIAPGDLKEMIAANEIQDANTLSMFARLVAGGLV